MEAIIKTLHRRSLGHPPVAAEWEKPSEQCPKAPQCVSTLLLAQLPSDMRLTFWTGGDTTWTSAQTRNTQTSAAQRRSDDAARDSEGPFHNPVEHTATNSYGSQRVHRTTPANW